MKLFSRYFTIILICMYTGKYNPMEGATGFTDTESLNCKWQETFIGMISRCEYYV